MEDKKLIMVPGPTNVSDRVMQAMLKPIISHRGAEFRALNDSITENSKYLFQTKGDIFVLTASGTGGVECAVSNSVNPGDKIIVPVSGLFSERMKEAVVRRGGNPIEISTEWGKAPTADQIRQVAEKEKDAKAIAIVYNETSTGVTVRDLHAIGKIAREKGLLFIVDAVSILGGEQLPVDEWNVDICVVGSQKCIACPPGLALISVSERAWETIEKTQRPFYFDLIQTRRFSAKSETPFTPAVPLFFALDEALKMVKEEGLEKRFKRHRICSEAFYKAVEAIGLKPLPEPPVHSNTVIAFNKPDGLDNAEVRKVMRDRYGVVIGGGAGKLKEQTFRIGCMGIISERETLQTVNALENALSILGHPIKKGTGLEAARQKFS